MNADQSNQIQNLSSSPFAASEDAGSVDALHLQVDQSGSLNLGDEPWFLKADFGREGLDLQVTGEDGQMVVIEGYFSADPPPDLISDSGAVLNGATATRLAGPIAPGQYAQAAQGPGANPIGRVETTSGTVQVTRADGTEVTLSQGDPVFLGDILETGSDAAVGITFADESTFSLGEEGRMTLDDMVYDPGDQSGSMQVNLLQGAFTFVSGQIAKTDPNAMVITTPTSTIGIRGTAGGGTVDAQGATTAALMPEADGFTGEMTIGNDAGFQTINQPFQAVSIVSFNAAPSLPFTMTPQQLGQTFGAALSALPNADQAIPGTLIDGANEGRASQQEAEQAAQEAEAAQVEAQEQAIAAEEQAQEALAEAEVAQEAEAQATAEAQAAEEAAADAIAAAEAAAAEAASPTATPEQIAAAEEAAQAAEEAQVIAEEQVAQAQEARTVAAQTQADAAQAEAGLASANAQLAQATVVATQAQAVVIQTSPTGAIASAAITFGIDTVPGAQELNDAQTAIIEAETLAQEADLQVQQAEAAVQQALAEIAVVEAEIQAEIAAIGSGQPVPGDAGSSEDTGPIDAPGDDPNGSAGDETIDEGPVLTDDGPVDGPILTLLNENQGIVLPGGPNNEIGPDPFGQENGPTIPFFDGNDGSRDSGPEDDTNDPVNSEFDEFPKATLGNNDLTGGPGNTQFIMTQDVSLNGIDAIDGGAGNDELYLGNLNSFEGIYDSANSTMEYSSSASGISGTITMTSIEQLYANDGLESDVRLNIDGESAGYGYIIAGDDGANTINVSDTSSLSELAHTIYDTDTLGTILFGRGGDDDITGTGQEDVIFGGDGNDILTGGGGKDTLNGGAGDDVINTEGQDEVDGGDGTDSMTLSDQGDLLIVKNVETITGGLGSDQITFSGSTVGGTVIDLADGIDAIVFDDVDNTATLTDVEIVVGGAGTDSLTISDTSDTLVSFEGTETITGGTGDDFITILDGLTAGSLIDGSGGTDTIDLSGSGNSTTLNDVEYIQGGSSADTLTLTNTSASSRIDAGGGADLIDLTGVTAGRQTVVIDETGDFGDTISGFSAGAGNDVIDYNASLNRGASTSYKDSGDFETFTASASATVGTNSVVVVVSNSISGYASATLVATALATITALTSGNTVLLATGNGTNTHLWSWQGTGSTIDSGDLTSVAELVGVDHATLISDNFAGFTAHSVSGTQGVTMAGNGTDDIITGSGTSENVTLTGAAQVGDTFDGAAGTDFLNLDDTVNSISVSNTETINGGSSTDTVRLLTALTSGTVDLAGGAQDRLALADGTNSLSLSNTEYVIGGSGDDSITLANAANQVTTSDVETITGGTGIDTIIAIGSVTDIAGGDGADVITAGGTITSLTGGNGADILTVIGSNGTIIDGGNDDDKITGGNGSDTLTGGAGADVFHYTAISQADISLGDAITDFNANSTDLIDISEIHLAGSFSYSALVDDGNASAFLNGLILEFDASGDGAADMEIDITGYTGTLDTDDFITV